MNLIKTLKELGGFWKYEGGRYLARLTSGKVSDTFCNTGVLTCKPGYLKKAVGHLIHKKAPDATDDVDTVAVRHHDTPNLYVCGPAMGGVTLAYEVARQLGATAIFTEPVYGLEDVDPIANDGQRMSFQGKLVKKGQELKRFEISDGHKKTILFVEDVITTGQSTIDMIEVVQRAIPRDGTVRLRPFVMCLVNRSGNDRLNMPYGDGWGIVALEELNARTWDNIEAAQEVLPDVREAVRPKTNWEQLTNG